MKTNNEIKAILINKTLSDGSSVSDIQIGDLVIECESLETANKLMVILRDKNRVLSICDQNK